MKKRKTTTTPHGSKEINKVEMVSNHGVRQHFKLGLDLDLRQAVVALQCDEGEIKRALPWTRAQLLAWVKIALGHRVSTVYEACGFGYTLHRALSAAGAHSQGNENTARR